MYFGRGATAKLQVYPKDVNKEFLGDIESDRGASNGDSTDDDSEDENVAEMDDEALYS